MSQRVCVIDLPGLSRELLAAVPATTALGQWLSQQRVHPLTPSWPAVTCSVQATLSTGVSPAKHGIVANGLATFRSQQDQALVDASSFAEYRRDVSFWEQSNQLIQAPRFWQDPSTGQSKYKTALLFLQNSMPGFVAPLKPAADIVITPKPEHGPDGKITSLLWAEPRELVPRLFKELGPFPLMNYWGPLAKIDSSRWIAAASAIVWRECEPQLQWVYVPHLDYDLQRFGPDSPQAKQAVQDVASAVDALVSQVLADGAELVVLSEYAVKPVRRSIQPNRLLAEAGRLVTRESPDGAIIDYARSSAFAMCDHQIAHVYLQNSAVEPAVRKALSSTGMKVVSRSELLSHRRAGDLLLEAPDDAWLDYRWWSRPGDAPTFAATVDIHRKPGYDPLELFFDPESRGTAQDAGMVRGSHGRVATGEAVLIGNLPAKSGTQPLQATDVAAILQIMLCG